MARCSVRDSLTAVVAAGVLLTSCSSSPEPEPEPGPDSSTEPAQETPAPTSSEDTGDAPTSALEPFGEHGEPVRAEPSTGAELRLVELTSGEHERYDRVVLTFAGEGTPGWQVGYQAEPSADGSGRPIEVDGAAALAAHVAGLVLPTEGDGQLAPNTSDPDLPEIEEVHLDGWFEGQVQLVLGIDSADAPFRVFGLTEPTRLVIDVQHVDE